MNFVLGPYVITIPAGQISAKFDILVMDDDIGQSFSFTIHSSSLPSYVTIGDPSQATVIIKDDDHHGMATYLCTYYFVCN